MVSCITMTINGLWYTYLKLIYKNCCSYLKPFQFCVKKMKRHPLTFHISNIFREKTSAQIKYMPELVHSNWRSLVSTISPSTELLSCSLYKPVVSTHSQHSQMQKQCFKAQFFLPGPIQCQERGNQFWDLSTLQGIPDGYACNLRGHNQNNFVFPTVLLTLEDKFHTSLEAG